MHIHLDKVENIIGFAAENARASDTHAKILTRANLTSDDPEFYKFIEKISEVFLNKAKIMINCVYQFLIVAHEDSSADIYINEFKVESEILSKRAINAGELLMQHDIADIRKIRFPDVAISETDKVVYSFKAGWRFGLFFDFGQKFDLENMELEVGRTYRYLLFYNVYKTLETTTQFNEMMKDGWFPFIEIIPTEYNKLSEAYKNPFDLENQIKQIVDEFSNERIEKIIDRWWKNQIFLDKKSLIEAGINAYLHGTPEGYINCIKNLTSEVEGILRKIYLTDTGKGNGVRTPDLISHITQKGKKKTNSDSSLLLPVPFLSYMQDIVFAGFNVETGDVELSRNSSCHGVANSEQYTKNRALQLILILDQIFFYL